MATKKKVSVAKKASTQSKPATRSTLNVFALLSLIFGIVGFMLPLGGIVAIVLGIIALNNRRLPRNTLWMAWVGIVLGIIKVIMMIFIVSIMAFAG